MRVKKGRKRKEGIEGNNKVQERKGLKRSENEGKFRLKIYIILQNRKSYIKTFFTIGGKKILLPRCFTSSYSYL